MFTADTQDLDLDGAYIMNDITLTTIIIILFFALVFATLASSAKILQQSSTTVVSQTTPQKPTEQTSNNHYGEVGFPEAESEKGLPEKEAFNQELVISESVTIRPGIIGNKVWNFETLDSSKERTNLVVYIDKHGELTFRNQTIEIEWMQKEINRLSLENHVFVKLIIDNQTSIKVYETVRSYLWNESDAIHWEFITE